MPTVARALTGICIRSVVLFTNVVVLIVDPFQCTVELLTKFKPVSVSVVVELPTMAELGESDNKVGAG